MALVLLFFFFSLFFFLGVRSESKFGVCRDRRRRRWSERSGWSWIRSLNVGKNDSCKSRTWKLSKFDFKKTCKLIDREFFYPLHPIHFLMDSSDPSFLNWVPLKALAKWVNYYHSTNCCLSNAPRVKAQWWAEQVGEGVEWIVVHTELAPTGKLTLT